MELKAGTVVNKSQCSTCPFLRDGLKLTPEKMTEIFGYLLLGQNHFCHSDNSNKTICRGGRDYQLEIWHKLGIISAPTDEALADSMRSHGIQPKEHIVS